MPTPSVPLDSMWVFGGRDNTSALTNSLYALTTSLPWELKGVTAGAEVDNTYSPTGLEDYTRSTHGWNYQTSPVRDFGSPERPTPQPAPVIVNQGAPQTSVCGEYGSILGGYLKTPRQSGWPTEKLLVEPVTESSNGLGKSNSWCDGIRKRSKWHTKSFGTNPSSHSA